MKMGLVLGIGAGAITTYALMSKSCDLAKNIRKFGKKIVKKVQDITD